MSRSTTRPPMSPRVPSAVGGGAVGALVCWVLGVLFFGASTDAAAANDAILAVPWPILGVVVGGLTALAGYLPRDLASQLFAGQADEPGMAAAPLDPAGDYLEDDLTDDPDDDTTGQEPDVGPDRE